MSEDKKTEYVKATIHTTTQGAEALTAVLPVLGISGHSVEDPADLDFIIASKDVLSWDYVDCSLSQEQGCASDNEVRVTFWLEKEAGAKLQEIRVALLKLKSDELYGIYGDGADFGRLWLDTENVYDDWKDKYKESFRAFSPCEGVFVVPPWERAECTEKTSDGERSKGLLTIVIDPGMAFGTGSHETTSMCLSKLKALIRPGDSVLDAGTGSGILAITAALLGATDVVAVEIDADAAESAARNIEANGAQEAVSLVVGDIAKERTLPPDKQYDLITANLSCALLEALLPAFKSALKGKGTMILSGLLDSQEGRALQVLKNEGLRPVHIEKSGEWLMLEVHK